MPTACAISSAPKAANPSSHRADTAKLRDPTIRSPTIEGFFAKLKQWRRIATRYDKLAANFLGFIKLASIMLWLK